LFSRKVTLCVYAYSLKEFLCINQGAFKFKYPMTFKEAECLFRDELAEIYPINETDAMTQVIFKQLFGFSRFQMHLNAKSKIPEKSRSQIYDIIYQLKQYKPLQYILGETEFYGLPFSVNESVLIPRPETEELVEWIIMDCKDKENTSILDIGTGSGCIAVTLAKSITGSYVSAIDISEVALNTAKKNADSNNVTVDFKVCNILQPNMDKFSTYDVIVSNPPYVAEYQKNEMFPNVLNFEPHVALFVPEKNPFIFYEAIALFAKQTLNPKGCLYFEINEKYPNETALCIEKQGFVTELKCDINNKYRMIKAWRNG